MERCLVDYCLRFNQFENFQNVSFGANLTKAEIDSLAFLFSVYFDQEDRVLVKGLNFFNEFNKCVELIKRDFEKKDDTSEVKNIFSLFLKDEFIGQVPNFQKIIKYLTVYYKPIPKPNLDELSALCADCPDKSIGCFACKCRYLSAAVSTFDAGIQEGWDIFLRPMFGLPLYLTVLLNTEFGKSEIFNADDLITNAFTQFLYNLLCDKASTYYVKIDQCKGLLEECRRVTVGLNDRDLEQMLSSLNESSINSKLYSPFKRFMEVFCRINKIKKRTKIVPVMFMGFYLRNYLEAAPNKTMSAADLELRNVCRLILKHYTLEQYEEFIIKLKDIKTELSAALCSHYIIPERFIRQLCVKYHLDKDISILINNTHNE